MSRSRAPYVPVLADIALNPKVSRLRRRLGLSTPETVGSLVLIWAWAVRARPDGDLSDVDPEDIEAAAEWSGEDGAFVDALRAARWLDEDGMLHDWELYGGKCIKEREGGRDRQRRSRERKARARHAVSRDVTVTDRDGHDMSRIVRDEERRVTPPGAGTHPHAPVAQGVPSACPPGPPLMAAPGQGSEATEAMLAELERRQRARGSGGGFRTGFFGPDSIPEVRAELSRWADTDPHVYPRAVETFWEGRARDWTPRDPIKAWRTHIRELGGRGIPQQAGSLRDRLDAAKRGQ